MVNTNKLTIVFVHGLASKPPAKVLHDLWKKAFIENIRIDSKTLANELEANPGIFKSAYWANAIPDHIEDTDDYISGLKKSVTKVIGVRKREKNKLHIDKKGWAAANTKKFGLSIVNALGSALTIKDNVIEEYMREVRLYKNDQFIAEQIRQPLEDILTEAWDKKHKVVLISHSMGTFISYDVLWKFSHRSEDKYTKYRNNIVDYFITMGSPLGDDKLRDFMLIERWKKAPEEEKEEDRKRLYPLNIKQWHNFSAYGDVVCHDSTLEDDFFIGMKENNVRSYRGGQLRDYVKLYNPFVTAEDKKNPHKSYGYLIQPKLSQKFKEFMGL
jgi:lecithin:cholesterol acyltransferase